MHTRISIVILVLACFMASCRNQSREDLMAQGLNLASQGNYKGSIVVYKNILEKYPGDTQATLALTDVYLRSGKMEQAAVELSKAGLRSTNPDQVALLTARLRNAENKPDQALEVLRPLLAASPPLAEAYEQAGVAMLLQGRFVQAQEQYETALALAPALVNSRLGLAEACIKRKLPDQAKRHLEEVLKTAPTNREAFYMLLQLQMQGNDEDGAIATYAKLSHDYPSDLRARYGEAFLRLGRKKDLAFAQATADALIKQFPNAPEGYKLKGLVYLTNKQNDQAVASLLQANKFRPDSDTNIFLAEAYGNIGSLETAVSHLQVVLARNPNLPLPRRMLAAIYLRQNRLDEAIAEAQKILEKTPFDDTGERLLGDALVAKHEFDQALEVFSKLSAQEGQPPIVHVKKGLLLAMKDDAKGAEEELRKAVNLGGPQLEPRVYLASFLASRNREDEAVAILGQGQEAGPAGALGRNAMAKLRLRQGQLDQAKALLEEAKRLDPSVVITYYNLAAYNLSRGDLGQAGKEYEAALAIQPNDSRALKGAAECLEALGDNTGAQALLERAAATVSPQANLELAEFFVRRKQPDRALDVVEKCLSTAPDMTSAWVLKSRLLALEKQPGRALEALSRVETLNLRLGILEKAKFYLSQKMSDRALEMAGKLRDINPQSGDYYLPLAEIQQIEGQTPAAKLTLQAALRVDPSNVKVLSALADIESRQHNTAEAQNLMDKAIAAGMDPATGYAIKGALLQRGGDMQAAEKQYEKSLDFKNDQPMALNNLAMIYADREGYASKALEMAIRACTVQAGNPQLLDTLGYALLKNGLVEDGVKILERAQAIAPDNQDIKVHLEKARESASKIKS